MGAESVQPARVLAAAAAGVAVLCWWGRSPAPPPLIEIHVRLAEHAVADFAARPLFTHLPASADDARTRWRRLDEPSWRAHGTAVLGEVIGKDNGRGVVGIAPDVERVVTSSIGGVAVADAIDTAAEVLRPGDVLLIELHSLGPRGRYVPEELW